MHNERRPNLPSQPRSNFAEPLLPRSLIEFAMALLLQLRFCLHCLTKCARKQNKVSYAFHARRKTQHISPVIVSCLWLLKLVYDCVFINSQADLKTQRSVNTSRSGPSLVVVIDVACFSFVDNQVVILKYIHFQNNLTGMEETSLPHLVHL